MQITETYRIKIDIADQLESEEDLDSARLWATLRSVNGGPAVVIPEKTHLDMTRSTDPLMEKLAALRQSVKDRMDGVINDHLGPKVTYALKDYDLSGSIGNYALDVIQERIDENGLRGTLAHDELPQPAPEILESLRTQIDAGHLDATPLRLDVDITARAEACDEIPTSVTVQTENTSSMAYLAGYDPSDPAYTVLTELPTALT